MVLALPSEEIALQPGAHIGVPVRFSQVVQFLRIGFQVEQHRPESFCMDIFPPLVADHDEPRCALIVADDLAGFAGGVIEFADRLVAPLHRFAMQQRRQITAFQNMR